MAVFRELVIFVPQKQSFLHIMEVRVINKSHHPLPQYATSDSAGMDLRANLDRPIVLKPLERCLVPTGLYIALPHGTEAQIRPRSGLALKKGTGSEFFDIFKIIQDVFSTTLGGLGLNIMCMGGFAKYMDKLEAGRSLYDVVSAPLKYVKNPYMLAMAGFIVDQLLGMAIPSASGLGLLMMVTMYPVFIRAGVPRMTAVCVIAAGESSSTACSVVTRSLSYQVPPHAIWPAKRLVLNGPTTS